jgi:hypothetical protein
MILVNNSNIWSFHAKSVRVGGGFVNSSWLYEIGAFAEEGITGLGFRFAHGTMASISLIDKCVSIQRTYFQKTLFKHDKIVPCMIQKVCKHAAKR